MQNNNISKDKVVGLIKRLTEAEEASTKTNDTFSVLDECRTHLQDGSAQLVINLPGQYQTLYSNELGEIYQLIEDATQKVIELASKIHSEASI